MDRAVFGSVYIVQCSTGQELLLDCASWFALSVITDTSTCSQVVRAGLPGMRAGPRPVRGQQEALAVPAKAALRSARRCIPTLP